MSRPAVLAALVGVALASSLPGEEVLKHSRLLFISTALETDDFALRNGRFCHIRPGGGWIIERGRKTKIGLG